MRFLSIRIITDNLRAQVSFYESAFAAKAQWLNEEFAELKIGGLTLALGSTKTLAFFGGNIAAPASNKSAIFEFLVPHVDHEFKRIQALGAAIVQEPKTMPWGNRSLLFRDPDGNLLNFFTPVSPEALRRFSAEMKA